MSALWVDPLDDGEQPSRKIKLPIRPAESKQEAETRLLAWSEDLMKRRMALFRYRQQVGVVKP